MINVFCISDGYDNKHNLLGDDLKDKTSVHDIKSANLDLINKQISIDGNDINKAMLLDIDMMNKSVLEFMKFSNVKTINSLDSTLLLLNNIIKYKLYYNIMYNTKSIKTNDEPYLANYQSRIITNFNSYKEMGFDFNPINPILCNGGDLDERIRKLLQSGNSIEMYKNKTRLFREEEEEIRRLKVIDGNIHCDTIVTLELTNIIEYIINYLNIRIFEIDYIKTELGSIIISNIYPSLRSCNLSVYEIKQLFYFITNCKEYYWINE